MCCPQPVCTHWQNNKIPELGDYRTLNVKLINKNMTAITAQVSSLPFLYGSCYFTVACISVLGSNTAKTLKFHFVLNFSGYTLTVISSQSA
jgi:hypothetical protein